MEIGNINEELRACSACGATEKLDLDSWDQPNYCYYYVRCKCGCRVTASTREKAIVAWNTHPLEDALRAELATANKVIDGFQDEMTRQAKVIVAQGEQPRVREWGFPG